MTSHEFLFFLASLVALIGTIAFVANQAPLAVLTFAALLLIVVAFALRLAANLLVGGPR